jgi:DNA-binding transcriptional LysR family regulator
MYLRDLDRTWSFEKLRARKKNERISVPVNGPLRANNSEVLREAALGGLGIALLPDFTASDLLKHGQLQHVLADWKPVGFFGQQIYAIRPWAAQVPRAVRVLVEHLRESFKQ